MTATYRLTAHVPFLRRLLLRVYHRLHRNDDYPKYTFVMQSNPQGNKRWRKLVLRTIQRTEALKALTHYQRRYLIEVKADPQQYNTICIGIFPIEGSAHLYDARGPGHEGSLAVYFELYQHEMTHVPYTAARKKLAEVSRYPSPPRHFRVPYYD